VLQEVYTSSNARHALMLMAVSAALPVSLQTSKRSHKPAQVIHSMTHEHLPTYQYPRKGTNDVWTLCICSMVGLLHGMHSAYDASVPIMQKFINEHCLDDHEQGKLSLGKKNV